MKISFDTVKTTAFVLRHRLRGYELLQNPKGTNPNEVKMIKSWFGFDGERYDKFYSNKMIHRKQEGDKFVINRTEVFTEYLMDPETHTYSGKNKNIRLFKSESGYKEIEATSFSEMEKRPLPKWTNEDEEFDFGARLFEENREKEETYYLPSPEKSGNVYLRPFKPNFWQVLKTNLKGGGIDMNKEAVYKTSAPYTLH